MCPAAVLRVSLFVGTSNCTRPEDVLFIMCLAAVFLTFGADDGRTRAGC
jgi:hypothetical protein